jgi:hypothetical protein
MRQDLCDRGIADCTSSGRSRGYANASGFSSEAVLYKNASSTKEAFAELRHAAATCPPTFIQQDVAGTPPPKTVFGPTQEMRLLGTVVC